MIAHLEIADKAEQANTHAGCAARATPGPGGAAGARDFWAEGVGAGGRGRHVDEARRRPHGGRRGSPAGAPLATARSGTATRPKIND